MPHPCAKNDKIYLSPDRCTVWTHSRIRCCMEIEDACFCVKIPSCGRRLTSTLNIMYKYCTYMYIVITIKDGQGGGTGQARLVKSCQVHNLVDLLKS